MSAKKGCILKLKKEMTAFTKEPPPYIPAVAVNEKNILEWHYLIEGPPQSPYEGGWYIGKLRFPPDYPFKPPAIMMCTPSGRFQINTRLCLSMSDFHPETWNPMWSIASVLTGLLSFMLEDTPTTGSVEATVEERRKLAQESLAFNLQSAPLKNLFPQLPDLARQQQEKQKMASQPPNDGDLPSPSTRSSQENGSSRTSRSRSATSTSQAPAAAYARAVAAAATGQFYSAVKACEQIIGEQGPSSYGRLLAAAFYLRLGSLAEARAHLNEVKGLEVPVPGAQAGSGKDVVQLVDLAESELARGERLLSGGGAVEGESSSGRVKGTDPKAALNCFERVINKFCTHSASVMMSKARALVVLGELDSAVATLEEASQMISNDPGSSHWKSKSGPEGLVTSDVVASALSRARTAARHRARGNEQFKKKNYVMAIKAYDSALASAETCAVVHCNRAAALAAVGRYEDAITACDRSLEFNSTYTKARRRKADSLAALGRHGEAAAEYLSLVQLFPEDSTLKELLRAQKELA